MADSLDELNVKLERWKAELSAKGLKVNTKKTKIRSSPEDREIPMQCLLEKVLGVTPAKVTNIPKSIIVALNMQNFQNSENSCFVKIFDS